ncbi:conjugal transfer protein TraI [Galbibacter sp. EGI 63066]|uniref:conjugal transfer protein TraI n=1 Tax=Galbibacter sp. EGI 63066 TaxID=2993559 RepID=UPI002248B3E8|nr:conjugal transfer protein TraI [Galbibacter sp. EGI 63066]MCX2680988.1 conjugal transfer protein TraI [Galbibacter sp. EGI 63066]
MKSVKKTMIAVLLLGAMLMPQPTQATPIGAIIRQAVIRAIKAIDLKIQRLQTETIWLQNVQKTIENALSKLKLEEISEWSEKQRTLYADYYQELWKVKNIISTYRRVRDITGKQLHLMEEYQRAWNLLKEDPHFSTEELRQMEKIYSGVLKESADNLDHLIGIVHSFHTQMSDGERMKIIHQVDERVQSNLDDLRLFNRRNFGISSQRGSALGDNSTMENLYK